MEDTTRMPGNLTQETREISISGTMVRTKEVWVLMVVMMIWLWSCCLFYKRYRIVWFILSIALLSRWSKFSRLETFPTYFPQATSDEEQPGVEQQPGYSR